MKHLTMTNGRIVQLMRSMTDAEGEALRKKQLPFQLVYALRRSIPELQKVYAAYEATLKDICQRYDTTPVGIADADPKCVEEVAALVGMEVELAVYTVPSSTLDKVDGDRYDPLTFEELDRLWWLVE